MTAATIQDLRDRVTAAVDLGPTADAIADRIRARAIKGERESALGCPIARAIKADIPDAERVIVGGTYAIVRVGDTHARVDLPAAGRTFVRRFDDGYGPYLDLIAPAVMP